MADLVAEYRGELRLVVEVRHDPAGDVDVPAGQREGVGLLAIEHRERPGDLRTVALGGQTLPEVVDVALETLVVVTAVLLQDLRVHFAPDLDLFLLGHRDDIRTAGGGVACAASREPGGAQRRQGENDRPTSGSGHCVSLRTGTAKSRGRSTGGKVPGHQRQNGAPRRPVYATGRKAAQPRAYFLRKRSTRPPVSTIFCLPV